MVVHQPNRPVMEFWVRETFGLVKIVSLAPYSIRQPRYMKAVLSLTRLAWLMLWVPPPAAARATPAASRAMPAAACADLGGQKPDRIEQHGGRSGEPVQPELRQQRLPFASAGRAGSAACRRRTPALLALAASHATGGKPSQALRAITRLRSTRRGSGAASTSNA